MRRAQADFRGTRALGGSDRRAAVAGCGARSPIDGIEVSTLPEVPRATAIAQGARCSMLWVGFTATQRASDPGRRAIRHLGARRSSRVGAFGPSTPAPDGAPRAACDLAAQNTGPRAKSTHRTRTALPVGRPIVRPPRGGPEELLVSAARGTRRLVEHTRRLLIEGQWPPPLAPASCVRRARIHDGFGRRVVCRS